jgi:hypothetical protein
MNQIQTDIQTIIDFVDGNGGTWLDAAKAGADLLKQGLDAMPPGSSVPTVVGDPVAHLRAAHAQAAIGPHAINWGNLIGILLPILLKIIAAGDTVAAGS